MKATDKQTRPTRHALNFLVGWTLSNRYCSGAEVIRQLLLSLYHGDNKCDLSAVHRLDTEKRRALSSLLIGIGRDVYDYEIRDTFALISGESGLLWFFEPIGGLDKEALDECMEWALASQAKNTWGRPNNAPANCAEQ